MRNLVTGGAGFVGSHLIDHLMEKGEEVICLDNYFTGNKSKIIKRDHGINTSGYLWAMGEHDGYNKYGATHKRLIKSVFMTNGKLNLIIEDEVYCSKPMFLRQWWHLGPEKNNKLLLDIKSQFKKSNYFESEITKTFLADGFGKRIIRNSLCIYGIIKPGNYILSVNLII